MSILGGLRFEGDYKSVPQAVATWDALPDWSHRIVNRNVVREEEEPIRLIESETKSVARASFQFKSHLL